MFKDEFVEFRHGLGHNGWWGGTGEVHDSPEDALLKQEHGLLHREPHGAGPVDDAL